MYFFYFPSPGTIQSFPACDCEEKTIHLHPGTEKRPKIGWKLINQNFLRILLREISLPFADEAEFLKIPFYVFVHLLIKAFFQRPQWIDNLPYECDGAADRTHRGGEKSFGGMKACQTFSFHHISNRIRSDMQNFKSSFSSIICHDSLFCLRKSVWEMRQQRDLNGGGRRC